MALLRPDPIFYPEGQFDSGPGAFGVRCSVTASVAVCIVPSRPVEPPSKRFKDLAFNLRNVMSSFSREKALISRDQERISMPDGQKFEKQHLGGGSCPRRGYISSTRLQSKVLLALALSIWGGLIADL